MSKGLGKKIAIRFTEDLLSPSNFSNVALGKPFSTNGRLDTSRSANVITDDNIDSANYVHVHADGQPRYVEIDLGYEVDIHLVKVWHYYADNRTYYDTKTELSLDGNLWHTIFDSAIDGTYVESNIGKECVLSTPIKARYVRDWVKGSSANIGNHWVEIQAFGGELVFNKESFTVSGQEKKYIGGEFVNGDYHVDIVERHPTSNSENTILLTMKPTKRFNNVEGQLTVEYDNLKGDLQGEAGFVESFSIEFLPTDLIQKLNPIVTERFIANPTLDVNYIKVSYRSRHGEERFIATPNCIVNLINIDDINP